MQREVESDEYWVSISDLMSGLMIIFLLVAVSYMVQATAENKIQISQKEEAVKSEQIAVEAKRKIELIAENYRQIKEELYIALYTEFESDLKTWSAEIDKEDLFIRFREPDVLFLQGSKDIKPAFAEILNDFFPRYINVLTKQQFINDISEVRIEGHTSSEWSTDVPAAQAYFNNMELSQDRTRSVLEYVMALPSSQNNYKWLVSVLTANGLSSSKPIIINEVESDSISRRVEFRVKTNAEKRIELILRESGIIQ